MQQIRNDHQNELHQNGAVTILMQTDVIGIPNASTWIAVLSGRQPVLC